MTEARRQGRPRGSRNHRPTRQEINDYLELLRTAARDGDVQAAATLVQFHTAEQQHLKESTS